jgi:hypothetical protein
MRSSAAAVLLPLLVAGCGDRTKPAGSAAPVTTGDAGASHGTAPAARPSVTVTAAWSWGAQPKGEHGPRMRDPNEPLPTGPAFIAAGTGKLVIATQDSCLELLDGTTGKQMVPHHCEKDAWAFGLAVIGDVAIVARQNGVTGYSLADLKQVWRRETGFIQNSEPLARPGVVDGRFCVVATDDQSGVGIECLDPATGAPGPPWTIGRSRVAFGDRLIGMTTSHRPKSLPYADGLELMVEFHAVDRKTVIERPMAGQYGPRFQRSRPIFLVQTDGQRGRTSWFVGADGRDLSTVLGKEMLRGAAAVGSDVLTSEFLAAPGKDRAVRLRPDGAAAWRTDLGATGPWDPFAVAIGKTAFMTQGGKVFALDAGTGAIVKLFELESEHHGVWQDKVLFLVSARETRSDSDFGDAAVYAVDAASLEVVLRDELGKDVPGGQQASDPLFDGDMAYAIAGGRVHAYRIATSP